MSVRGVLPLVTQNTVITAPISWGITSVTVVLATQTRTASPISMSVARLPVIMAVPV